MAEIVVRKIAEPKTGKGGEWRIVTGADGQKVRIRKLDAGSQSFGDDLTRAFRANVRKARKANRLIDAG